MNVGFAKNNPLSIDWNALKNAVIPIHKEGKLAFGANAINWLISMQKELSVTTYPPEIFSRCLLLNDKLELYNNSFDMMPVPYTIEHGAELGHVRTKFGV
jgi:hypothetical protein